MIRFEQVRYTYPFQDRPAVADISFAVRPGEIVLCTGASGCGKSTLIRLANGLCPHYFHGHLDGDVLVGGRSTVAQTMPELARQAGTLFQDPEQQFFALGVEDELAFALEWQGMPQDEMHRTIGGVVDEFGLRPLLSSSIHELSEGQKQKVGLAAVSVQQPKALILDEPTANLDPEATEALAQQLLALKQRGMAILVVDHRLYWLDGIADRVLVMHEGRIAVEGDFSLLHDAALRHRYGLRSSQVRDRRGDLPDCSTADNPVLAVSGLSFAYKDRDKLYDRAAFTLPAGMTALIGGNGTGKTTLARLMTGLNTPESGVFRLSGAVSTAAERLHRTAIVLQNADHQLHMRTVRQEMETCLTLAGQTDQTVLDRLLAAFALDHLAQRHPQSLSGGEKQRLVIACALLKKPDILILDEPTSGLDGGNMARLAVILREFANQGGCILLITHDLELMDGLCCHALRLPLAPVQALDFTPKP